MAVKLFYFKNVTASGAPTNSLALQDGGTAPATGITTTGWTVAKLASPNTSAMLGNTKRASGTFQSGDSIPSFAGNSTWRSENPITGTFANASWTFAFRIRAVSSASSQTGQVKIRVYRSLSADGITAGLVNLTSTVQAGTTTAALSTSASATSTVTWAPGQTQVFNNEYLWVQCEWSIVGTSGNNNADAVFYIESTGVVTTPNFSQGYLMPVTAGAVSLTGNNANLTYYSPNIKMPVTVGAFTLSGKNVNLNYGTTLTETTIFSTTSVSNSAAWDGYSMRNVAPVTGMSDASYLVVVLDLGASSDLRLASGLGTIVGGGVGAMVCYTGPPISGYLHAHEGSGKLDGYVANLIEIKIRGSGATRQLCVRLEAPSASTININTASIGIWSGTNDPSSPYLGSTTFTPVQLKFGGSPNISLSNGATLYSDWSTFPDNVKSVFGAYNLGSINGGWNGYTFVHAINTANLRAASGTEIRVGLKFTNSTVAGQTVVSYIGQSDPLGDDIDFRPAPAPAPVRLTWNGGSNTLTHDGVNFYILSDWVTLPEAWDNTKGYALAHQFAGGGEIGIHYSATPPLSASSYYKSGADAATLNKSGYTVFVTNDPALLEIVEVRSAAGPAAYTMPVTVGAFNLASSNAYLIYGTPAKVLTAITGAFTLSGSSTKLLFGGKVVAAAGAFSLSGKPVGLRYDAKLPVTRGIFSLTGITTGLRAGRNVPTTKGTFTLTGIAAGLRAARREPVTVGAFTLSGKTVDLVWSGSGAKTLVAATGAFALSGKTTNLKAARKFVTSTGAFALTGNAVDLKYARTNRMPVTVGAFTLTRNPAVLRRGYVLRAGWGVPATVFDPAHTSPDVIISGLITTNTKEPHGDPNSQTALSFPSRGTKIYAEMLAINQEFIGDPGFGAALQSISVTSAYPGSDTNGIALYGYNIWYNDAMLDDPVMEPPVEQGQYGAVAVDRIAGTVQWRNISADNAWTTPVAFPISIANAVCYAISHYEVPNKFAANFDGAFIGKPPAGDYTRWNGTPIVPPVTLTGYPVNLTQHAGHIVLHVETGRVILSGFDVDLRPHQLFLEKQPGPLNFGYQNVYLNRW